MCREREGDIGAGFVHRGRSLSSDKPFISEVPMTAIFDWLPPAKPMGRDQYFEDFALGDVFRARPVSLSEDDIIEFARRYDPQPFHTDRAAAAKSQFGGLIASAGAALTGLLEWLALERGTPVWRTATTHMAVMVTAVVLFGIAAILQYDGFHDGDVTTGGLVLTLLGWVVLAAGGWLGGSLVFVHGLRVVGDEQAGVRESADPLAHDREPSHRRAVGGR